MQIKRLGSLLNIPDNQVKHIHWTSKKRISDHWKLLLRVCRNDPTSDYLIFVHCNYKAPKFISKGGRNPNLYETDKRLQDLANNPPTNAYVISFIEGCDCVSEGLTRFSPKRIASFMESGSFDLAEP